MTAINIITNFAISVLHLVTRVIMGVGFVAKAVLFAEATLGVLAAAAKAA